MNLVADSSGITGTTYRLELPTVEGFIERVEREEAAWTGRDRLAFLASVRRLYYGRSAGTPVFDTDLLSRYPGDAALACGSPARRTQLTAFKEVFDGPDRVDMGHVLVAIGGIGDWLAGGPPSSAISTASPSAPGMTRSRPPARTCTPITRVARDGVSPPS